MDKPTIDQLAQGLRYEPDTGLLFWKEDRGPVKAGTRAGCLKARGYIRVKFHGRLIAAHRIAFALTHGRWPSIVDHINRNPSDNRAANLRETTPVGNGQNRSASQRPSGRLYGTYYKARNRRWCAQIRFDGKERHLGLFDTEQAAHAAYMAAKRAMHPAYSGESA